MLLVILDANENFRLYLILKYIYFYGNMYKKWSWAVIDLLPWWVLSLLANASAENKMYDPEVSFKRCANLFWPYLNDKAYQQLTQLADDRLNSWDKQNLSAETNFTLRLKKADLFYKNCIDDNPDILETYLF